MSQEFTVSWVGDKVRQWQSKHGPMVDYHLAVAGYDDTLKLTQKPETAPPAVGQEIFGHIQVETVNPREGEPFDVHKLKKEQRPDFDKPNTQAVTGPQGGMTNPAVAPSPPAGQAADKPGPDFWAQKDRRLARAGVVQALVAGTTPPLGSEGHVIERWVENINVCADALLTSLDAHAPSPNTSPPQTQPGNVPVHTPLPESAGVVTEAAPADNPLGVGTDDGVPF